MMKSMFQEVWLGKNENIRTPKSSELCWSCKKEQPVYNMNGITLEADWKEEKIFLTSNKVIEIFKKISEEDSFILKMNPVFGRMACFELIDFYDEREKQCEYKQCHQIAVKFFCNLHLTNPSPEPIVISDSVQIQPHKFYKGRSH